MQEEDQPPEHIWLDNEELEMHFERVQARWKNPSGEGMEPIADGPLMQNELTRGLRAGGKGHG